MRCRICKSTTQNGAYITYLKQPKAAQIFHTVKDNGEDLHVFQCANCGVVQLANDPVNYWMQPIRSTHISSELQSKKLKQFELFCAWNGLKGKRVIEIGSASGDYLKLLEEAGMKPDGMENITHAFPNAPYAAFFMFNFLEHLPDPVYELKRICNVLEPGAVGIIEVPNFDYAIQDGQFSEFTRDHLFYFSRQPLHNLLESCGFTIIDSRIEFYGYILSVTVQKRKPINLMPFEVQRENLHREIQEWFKPFTRVAVWGAGHQSLMICALYNLERDIAYVVDSSPYKQGRLTPASNIKIVAPEQLKKEPVDSVLIIAGGYSDEIAKHIKDTHGTSMAIAIIRGTKLEVVND